MVIMPDDGTAFAAPKPVLDLFQTCVELTQYLSHVDVAVAGPATAAIAAELEGTTLAFPLLVRVRTAEVEACGVDTARKLADMCVQQRVNANADLLAVVDAAPVDGPGPAAGTKVPTLLQSLTTEPAASPQEDAAAHPGKTPRMGMRPPSKHFDDDSSTKAKSSRGSPGAAFSAGPAHNMKLPQRKNLQFS